MLRLVQVVNALKALQRSLVYGEEVSRLLQASPVWAQYEQQRHDLFIQVSHTENPPAGQPCLGTVRATETRPLHSGQSHREEEENKMKDNRP
jgi:hypothetical protein